MDRYSISFPLTAGEICARSREMKSKSIRAGAVKIPTVICQDNGGGASRIKICFQTWY